MGGWGFHHWGNRQRNAMNADFEQDGTPTCEFDSWAMMWGGRLYIKGSGHGSCPQVPTHRV
jgi:hypothetical protein